MPSTSNRRKQMKGSLSRSSILMSLALALLLAGRPRATREGRRLHLLRSAFASIGDLVAIAIILEVISQFLIFREFHPVAAFLVGPVVIALPYSCPGLWGIALPVGWLSRRGQPAAQAEL